MKKGFTLIEVMISLFILLAGMAGVIKLQSTSAVITKMSGDLTFAQNLAQRVLEEQLARPLRPLMGTTTPPCKLKNDATEVQSKGVTYKIDCKIRMNESPLQNNKEIGTTNSPAAFVSVEVKWTDLLHKDGTDLQKHQVFSYGILTLK